MSDGEHEWGLGWGSGRRAQKDIQSIVAAAEAQGFKVSRTQKGHIMFQAPDPKQGGTTYSGTPGDVRAINNLLSKLRQMGLVYPMPQQPKKE